MEDPLETRICLGCGAPLVELNPPLGMCTACFKGTKEKMAQAIKRGKQENNPKRFTLHIPMLARNK